MDIPFSKQQPEPCLKEQCRSVLACYAFGYCRERNEGRQPYPLELEERREIAAYRLRRFKQAKPNGKYPNGAPMYSQDGTLLDPNGNRSIFDDVDE